MVVQVLQGWYYKYYKYYKGGITCCDYRMGAGITPDCALGDKTPYKDISNSNSMSPCAVLSDFSNVTMPTYSHKILTIKLKYHLY